MAGELKFEQLTIPAGNFGEEASVPPLFGGQIMQNEVTFDLDETDEIFEAYGRTASCYPYREKMTYDRNLSLRSFETAVLDDGHLRAVFLPSQGGRLLSLYDFDHQMDLLYRNDVLRYSNLAVRNAWFSGGVEWNIGVIGHTPLTTEQLNVAVLQNEEGGDVLRMYGFERIRGLEYQMDFWLGSTGEDHYLNCRMRVVNSTQNTVPMYWWSNMAVPEYEGGRVAVPAQEAFTCAYVDEKSKVYKTAFPEQDGPDLSYYQNIKCQVDYFFNIPKTAPRFIANVNADGYGLLHLSTDRLRGRKLFTWGQNDASDHWQEFLTDHAGRYVEIQAGLAQTQYGCLPMAAHTAWEWVEQYSGIRIADENRKQPYPDFRCKVTQQVQETMQRRGLDRLLSETSKLAKTAGRVRVFGSDDPTLTQEVRLQQQERPLSPHLSYAPLSEDGRKWLDFVKTGIFPAPGKPTDRPIRFQSDAVFYNRLRETIASPGNRDNQDAHYHLGLMYLYHEENDRAEEQFRTAIRLSPAGNPWAEHGLAIVCWRKGSTTEMAVRLSRGVRENSGDLSYVKDAFRMLLCAKAYAPLLELHAQLPEQICAEHRVHYDYLTALFAVKPEFCLSILQELENSAFTLDDIREGDDDLGSFYTRLYQEQYGRLPDAVPHHLNFHSLQPVVQESTI